VKVANYTWTCRMCGGTANIGVYAEPLQTLQYVNSDGSVKSWARADVGASGIEHTCPPGTIKVKEKN
jgi:hypothetical protein